ncbi:CAP domain-containing protein [Meridianimarinicoccus sp. MJW13]|uniref:CAP domain-containing protein n=1 Tax=Meridianimarinicoccus sp. MJW13 TaxID=2720031 RepID=UPI00186896E8|nr:CAP domain-containing protein [Fluviibacterium sp. MJW13]
MKRRAFLVMLALAACDAGPSVNKSGVYVLRSGDKAEVQYRMLDSVNALRAGRGAPPLRLNAQLTSAAETHANDMSRQGRAWSYGSDRSNPYNRVARSGYNGALVAEIYSQSYETELETLAAWVDDGAWGDEILDPAATDMGFGWKQDSSGLIWWCITLGSAGGAIAPSAGF